MLKRPLLVSMALAAGIALAGCGAGEAEPTPTPSATAGGPSTPTSTPSPTPTPSRTATPAPSPTTAPDAWTGEKAYAACIAFYREKTAADGLDPDAATWDSYSPDVVQKNGAEWTVSLVGTVEDDEGNVYDGAFACTVAGTPSSPKVTESTGI